LVPVTRTGWGTYSGKDVIKVMKGGWRPSKKVVAEIVEMMAGLDLEGRIVILYGMDNGVCNNRRLVSKPAIYKLITK
jgi:hypothetical protein